MVIFKSPKSQFRRTIFFSFLLLLVLLLAGCRDRRAEPTATPTSPPAPTRATRAAANVTTPATVAAPTPERSLSTVSPSAVSSSGNPAPRLQALEEPFAAASPLEQAAWLHSVGDYSRELQLLQALLADPPTALAQRQEASRAPLEQERSAILYQLALAYLADDKPGLALDALEKLRLQDTPLTAAAPLTTRSSSEAVAHLTTRSNSEAVAHLTINSVFLHAEALAGLGLYAEAAAEYRTFLEQRPQVTGVVEELIADAWLAVGEWSQAANALRRAANVADGGWEKARLLDRLAGVLESTGRWEEAASVYDEIITAADIAEEERSSDDADPEFDDILGFREWSVYRVGYLYRAGAAYAAAGDEETAIAHWRRALNESADSNAAYQSLIQLVNRNVPVDLFLRGQIDLFAQAYVPAIQAFERFLEESPHDARAGDAWLGIARAQMGLGQWDAARLAIDQLLDFYPNCDCLGEAWMARAQLAIAEGSPAAGRRIYRTFARELPDDPLAPEALWLSALSSIAADSHLDAGAVQHAGVAADPFDEAVSDLLRLLDAFPDSQQAADGLAVAGIEAFAHGRYAQAANNFERLLTDYPDAQPDTATYWLGRARYAEGNTVAARSPWRTLAARSHETYYGVLAGLELMSSRTPPGQEIIPRMRAAASAAPALPGDDGSRAFAESWLSGPEGPMRPVSDTTGTGNNTALWVLPLAVASAPDLVGGEQLLALGRRAEGLKMLEQVYWRYRDDPAALYPLMLRFDALGANRLSITAAYHLITAPLPSRGASDNPSPARHVADAPLFLQRVAYPRHYFYIVEKEARDFDIDPLLLYSLIFQESLFEPPARSFAGAHGLTQIIPSTGAEIAQRLNYPNYSTALLNLPFVNIKFGAYYLRWVRDFVGDNDVAALAGYNAGPGNASIWLDSTAPDDALFVELVPYTETHRYLQRILTHYDHYLRLYAR